MAQLEDDFDFLVETTRRLIADLTRHLSPRPAQQRGSTLAQHVRETLGAVTNRIDTDVARFARAKSEIARATLGQHLRFYMQMVWAVHEAIPWLERHRHPLDLGALYFLDDAALAMVGRDLDIVAVDSPEYMYSTSSWPFRWLIEDELQEPFKPGRRPIVLFYPLQEAPSILLHGLFAHELAHATTDEFRLVDEVVRSLKGTKRYGQRLDAIVTSALQVEPHAVPQEIRARVDARLEDWVEELLCDHLALLFLGPSFLLAFACMLLSVSWSQPLERHPSTTFRLSLLLDHATRLGWDAILRAELPQIWQWLQFAAGASDPPSDMTTIFVRDMCRALAHRIRTATAKRLRGGSYTPVQYSTFAAEIAEMLTYDVLPAQLDNGKSADHRDIIFGAWLHVLSKHGKDPAALGKALAEREYQRFIAKALELSTTVGVWSGLEHAASRA